MEKSGYNQTTLIANSDIIFASSFLSIYQSKRASSIGHIVVIHSQYAYWKASVCSLEYFVSHIPQ
ncbi:MAG: hypothetical protein WCG25_09810 [bacterium]